jgi:HAD superfamily hydrolase (TIGR01484 family)
LRPLKALPKERATQIRYVLCDIDDTITTDGRLTSMAYTALQQLHDAGIKVVPITGRPAGWCDHIARMWPVFAVVGENGAFFMRYDHAARKMQQHFWTDPTTRNANRQKLDELASKILQQVPGSALASDQPYRLADLAIDFCEDVPPLPESSVEAIVALFEAAGATVKVSSIHVNGWFGQYDKLTMTQELFDRVFQQPLQNLQDQVLFIGDSPNDSPMFGFFPISVGVANVRQQMHRLQHAPKYVCEGEGGAGFAQMARHLLQARVS